MITSLHESAEGETKVCGWTRYLTRDLWLLSQRPYRLRCSAVRKQILIILPNNVDPYQCALQGPSMRISQLFNPFALKTAKTLWSFGHYECKRVNTKSVKALVDCESRVCIRIFKSDDTLDLSSKHWHRVDEEEGRGLYFNTNISRYT